MIIKSERLISKLRQSGGNADSYSSELSELKKQYDQHPEVIRYAYENMRLRDRLQKFHQSFPDCEQKIAEYESMLKYQRILAEKILQLEARLYSVSESSQKLSTNMYDSSIEYDNTEELTRKVILIPLWL